jgi:hypothetical protein
MPRAHEHDCENCGPGWWCSDLLVAILAILLVVCLLWSLVVAWQYRRSVLSAELAQSVCQHWQRWRMFSYLLFFAVGVLLPRALLFDNGAFTALAVVAFLAFCAVSFLCMPYYVCVVRPPSRHLFPDLQPASTMRMLLQNDVPPSLTAGFGL